MQGRGGSGLAIICVVSATVRCLQQKLWAWLEAIGLSPHQAGGQSRRCPLWASQMMAGPIIGRPARQCEFE